MSVSYITYFRVSTQRQGVSGLGLDAQREAVSGYLDGNEGTLIGSFVEVESGKRSKRPELEKALAACRKSGAVLLIAKLDRLARNVHFISGLIESGVSFIATDMPNADRFMLHVYAAMAEEEARRISDRTKAALAAAKAKGTVLGANGKRLATFNKAEANKFAMTAGSEISRLRSKSGMSFRQIAIHLNKSDSLPTQRGGKWHEATVHRVFTRHKALKLAAAM